MTVFHAERLSNRLTRIRGLAGELMYLVEAKSDAILIDSGCGIGSLKAFIKTLTAKPVTVFLTHGHVDHALGAPEFDKVYLNDLDGPLCDRHSPFDIREDFLLQSAGISQLDRTTFIPVRQGPYLDLKSGAAFKFGDITLQICEGRGHTQGSVTILIVEEQTLILGDACNHFTFLFDEDASGLTSYRAMLKRLDQQTRGHYNRVCLSHGDGHASIGIIQSVIAVCDDIFAGHSDDLPFQFMAQQAFIAKAINGHYGRLDGGEGNIVYAKDKIFS